MKKIKIIVLLFIGVLVSCENETGDISKVTTFAEFNEYTKVSSIPIGGTFKTDAKATEGADNIVLTSKNSIDNTTVGVYTYTSTATNSDGFSLDAIQTVIVHDPSIIGTDVSGNIRDAKTNTRTGVISLVEGTKSIFYCTDFAFGGIFPVYFQMNGDVHVPFAIKQTYVFSSVTNLIINYNAETRTFNTEAVPQGFMYKFEYK